MFKVIAILAILGGALYLGSGWYGNQQLKTALTNAGYTDVRSSNPIDPRLDATVRGCKIAFKGQRFAPAAKSVAGKRITEYQAYLVQDNGSLLRTGVDHAPTRKELLGYMKKHRGEFPCYKK